MKTHFPPITLKITITDEERKKLIEEYEEYDDTIFNIQHPVVQNYLKKLLDEFKGTVDTVKLQITTYVK